jgi:GNAT superfamily N-acetyltransferase
MNQAVQSDNDRSRRTSIAAPAHLLSLAFQKDPFICWAEPNPVRRPRTTRRVFAAMLVHSRRHGGYLHEPGVGAVLWRDAAAAHLGPLAVITSGMWTVALVAPPAVWQRLSAHEDAAMARVARFLGADSVYLGMLGVDPSVAGQGNGIRLLHRALEAQRGRWATCVLRTEQPRNVPFYLRNGFELVDEHVVAASGLRMWVFSRSLQPATKPDREESH